MGAADFCVYQVATSAKEAFGLAVEQAQYDYGHAGYTGTIAEKDEFRMFACPDGFKKGEEHLLTSDYRADNPYRDIADQVADKWGPAGVIDVTDTDAGREFLGPEPTAEGQRVFLLFGWASS